MPKQSYPSLAIARILGNYERAKALFVVDQLWDSDCDSDSVSIDLDSPSFLTYLSSKSKLDMGTFFSWLGHWRTFSLHRNSSM